MENIEFQRIFGSKINTIGYLLKKDQLKRTDSLECGLKLAEQLEQEIQVK